MRSGIRATLSAPGRLSQGTRLLPASSRAEEQLSLEGPPPGLLSSCVTATALLSSTPSVGGQGRWLCALEALANPKTLGSQEVPI